jgi:hypothetical protein
MKLLYTFILGLLLSCTTKQNSNAEPVKNPAQTQTKNSVITQNAKHLKPGDDLEIKINAEPLTDTSGARVKINGIDIPFMSNGIVSTATYVRKTDEALVGQYKVYVTVTHYKRDKEIKTENDTITYFIDK